MYMQLPLQHTPKKLTTIPILHLPYPWCSSAPNPKTLSAFFLVAHQAFIHGVTPMLYSKLAGRVDTLSSMVLQVGASNWPQGLLGVYEVQGVKVF